MNLSVIEIDIVLFSYLIPLIVGLNIVKKKRGGYYGASQGRYISNIRASVLLASSLLIISFIFSPLITNIIFNICETFPVGEYALLSLGLGGIYYSVKSGRKNPR